MSTTNSRVELMKRVNERRKTIVLPPGRAWNAPTEQRVRARSDKAGAASVRALWQPLRRVFGPAQGRL